MRLGCGLHPLKFFYINSADNLFKFCYLLKWGCEQETPKAGLEYLFT